jgi:hypothetical protein
MAWPAGRLRVASGAGAEPILISAPPGARKDIPTMRKIVLTVTAALALAAGALPAAAAGADPGPRWHRAPATPR